MHYVADTKGIRDAKDKVDDAKLEIEIANKQKQIDLIEKEIDLLNEKKEAINEQIDILDEQIDQINEYYDAQIKAIDAQIESIDRQIEEVQKQKEETEKYYESLIENLEKSKSKYEELTDIVKQAELSAALKKLGIDEEALINGSEEEFEKLKNAYMDVVFRLNAGNEEVLSSLRELSGYEGTAPSVLSESTDKLTEMNGQLDTSSQNINSVNTSLSDTAAKTSEVSTNVADMNTNLGEVTTIVTEEQTAFDGLKQKIDEVITAINNKVTAIQESQGIVGTVVNEEITNFLILKEKILEVKESLDSINTTVSAMDITSVNELTTAFQLLYDQLILVSNTLGAGMEGAEEGAVGGITSAIQALNEISLEDGIIAQFTNFKTVIDEVASAIGGGMSGGSSSGGESTDGSKSGGKGLEGEGSGGNSLSGAITEMGETAKQVIGESDAEGDGTVIGEFGALETAVTDVTSAIGSGDSEGGEGESSGSGESEDSGNLIGSIVNLGETSEETLGESGGDGVIGRFEEFKEVIEEAKDHVTGISEGLDDIDGKEVECTIKVNIETSGKFPAFATGTALDTMDLNGAEYNAKYTGNAHVEGTALAYGNWSVQSNEQSALVGEEGFEIIVRNGRFFTVGDNGAEMTSIKKGDIVFNHEQSVELLKHGHISGRGKAYADGTVGGGKILTKDGSILRPLQPGDKMYDLVQKFDAYFKRMDGNLDKLVPNSFYEHQRQMEDMAKQINYVSSITNNNRNVQPVVNQTFNITMPNVTNATSADALMKDLQSLAMKRSQVKW